MNKSYKSIVLKFYYWVTLILLFLQINTTAAQNGLQSTPTIAGAPFIRNYPPSEYGAHNQNWAIVQDKRGVMYFGNNYGVLEYDGVSWNTISLIQETTIRSLAIADDGRIYVGSFGEIGYLSPDTVQQLQFVSLLPHLEEKYRDFPDVWQTLYTSSGIYFFTPKYIFRWNGSEMDTWEAETFFHVGFEVNGQIFVRQKDIGLMTIKSDKLVLAPMGEKLADERIMAMFPFPGKNKNSILLGTRTNGLILYDGVSIEPFKSEAENILKEGQIYCGTQLSNGNYAFGTLQNGVVIIDSNGRLLHHLNKSTGLQDETIWYLYPDRQGGLWIGMHFGISRVEISSSLTYFGEREGVEGSVLDIARHKDKLYVITSMGAYYLDESKNPSNPTRSFNRVSGVSPQGWSLLPFGDVLLAATFEGVYEIRGDKAKVINSTYAMSLYRSRRDSNRVFVGLQSGLKSLYYSDGKWIDENLITGIDQEVLNILETPDHHLWLTARYQGLLMADFSKGFQSNPKIILYDTLQGLPPGERKVAFYAGTNLRFTTSQGIYRFDEVQQRFFPDTILIKGLKKEDAELYSISKDLKGNLWVVGLGELNVALRQPDNTYEIAGSKFLRIAAIDDYFAYPDPEHPEITWIGSIDRVIRYDGSKVQDSIRNLRTLLRSVIVNGDSILYGGADAELTKMLILKNTDKSLRFRFAAPSFDDESMTQYQYRLEGYDPQWSDWSTETYKDYTGLSSGTYRFLVRSKDLYQQIGETAEVNFRILPPFYLRWWAYMFYALLLAALVFSLRQMEMRRVRKIHLRELKQLEFDKLKELDQLKSRFFADISHEFRTPLTLILGPADHLLSSKPDTEHARQYQMIKRNAQRLLRLINQLLDLSKLEAGKMKLELHNEDIIPVLKGIVHSFESLVQSKKVHLSLSTDLDSVFLDFDRDKVEQILSNLISNAVKFTPEGGNVMVAVTMDGQDEWLQIDVTDTGFGISAEQLAHVFDRFYQGAKASHTGEPGSGIGLALAKELVELHQGRISVRSIEHQGTTFSIELPVKNEKLKTGLTKVLPGGERTSFLDEAVLESVVSLIEENETGFENTLLLVEDNPDMRTFIRETLVGNYRVIEAFDGQDGIEKAFEIIPDIIISDVMMPRKDGLELCEILKSDERTSHIPIILLTAKVDIESRLAGLERGADDYLAKPFNREELLIRSRNLLELRKKLWQRYSSIQPPLPAEDKDVQIEDAFLQKIRGLVDEHLSDSEFEIDRLSRLVGMSRSQMFRKIKALTGQSPSLFIRSIRLYRAKELLEGTEMNVSEVAYQVGFSTPTYFSDAFTETFGFRPSQVKK